MKYIDDLSFAAAIDLKDNLFVNTDTKAPLPPPYHESTGHILPYEKDVINQEFNKLKQCATDHEMIINEKKQK